MIYVIPTLLQLLDFLISFDACAFLKCLMYKVTNATFYNKSLCTQARKQDLCQRGDGKFFLPPLSVFFLSLIHI